MGANIEGLAGFTKRNRRSCEIFYARREKTFFLFVNPANDNVIGNWLRIPLSLFVIISTRPVTQ